MGGDELLAALQRGYIAGGCAACTPAPGHNRCYRLAPPPSGRGCEHASPGCGAGLGPGSGAGAAAGHPPGVCGRPLVGYRDAWREQLLDASYATSRGRACRRRPLRDQAEALPAGGASGAGRDRGGELPSASALPLLTPHRPTAQQRGGRPPLERAALAGGRHTGRLGAGLAVGVGVLPAAPPLHVALRTASSARTRAIRLRTPAAHRHADWWDGRRQADRHRWPLPLL